MRWKLKKKVNIKINSSPSVGDKRIIRKFLIIPRYFDREWRWMEFAHIEQTYYKLTNLSIGIEIWEAIWKTGWENVGWADDDGAKIPPSTS